LFQGSRSLTETLNPKQGIPEAMKRLENTIKDKMEFQARISAVIPTRSLTEEEMKQVLLNPKVNLN
jgi:hypothetical protein